MKSEDAFVLIFGIALISITIVGASNPVLRESLDLTRIPNHFQKNINKSIYVVEYADSTSGYVGGSYGDEALLRRCLKEPQTISSQKLQELFSSGVKTISAQPWKNDREYVSLFLFGVCGGQFYVLDGPENLLNKL